MVVTVRWLALEQAPKVRFHLAPPSHFPDYFLGTAHKVDYERCRGSRRAQKHTKSKVTWRHCWEGGS